MVHGVNGANRYRAQARYGGQMGRRVVVQCIQGAIRLHRYKLWLMYKFVIFRWRIIIEKGILLPKTDPENYWQEVSKKSATISSSR